MNVSGGRGLKATPASVTVHTAADSERSLLSIHEQGEQNHRKKHQQSSHGCQEEAE